MLIAAWTLGDPPGTSSFQKEHFPFEHMVIKLP